MSIQKIKAGRVTQVVADEWVGPYGTLFYNEDLGDLRVGDGVTPGGILLSFGGGEGGNYSLPTATTTVKGGVKIDGTTIAITNQVIRVGTVPYSSLSGTPTIPTNNNQLTNGAAYITSAALSGLATESYVTTRGYITTSALTDYALTSAVPTNNNQLSNGAAYITSSALTGLATETYVTTRGYLTTVAYADITNKPTLFSGSYVDLTNKPTIPTDINQLADASGLLGQGGGGGGTTYITNNVENPFTFSIAGDDSTLREIANGESIKITGAGGITVTTDAEGNLTVTGTPVSLAGYATESYVTSRGYITGLSFNDLTDKPNLAGTYTFNVAADDSTLRTIGTEETVKFVGASGITTSSDDEGKITITQGTTSSLVNGASTVSLGSDGTTTFPDGYLKIVPNGANPYISNRTDNGLGLVSGSAIQIRQSDADAYGISIDSSTTNTVGTSTLAIGSSIDVNGSKIVIGKYTYTSDVGSNLTSQNKIEINNNAILIGPYSSNTVDGSTVTAFTGWTFGTDGNLTFPDTTVQITAWTGVADYNNLINKPNLAGTYQFSVAADDSTQRLISTDEVIKFVGASGITTASDADGNITITGPSLAGLATETFVTTQGYITGLSYNDLTDKPDLAATYTWSIAADDSTLREILANETVKFIGAGSITTASDAEGNITITGAAPDRLTSNARSAVLNSNGTFSLPTLAAEPATPQAGQMALANGTSWDPIAQNNGAPYMVIYTGSAWIGMGSGGGGVTMDEVYMAILELGPTTL